MKESSPVGASDENACRPAQKKGSLLPVPVRKPLTPLQPKLGKAAKDEMVGKALSKPPSPIKKRNTGIENSPLTPEKPGPSAAALTKVQAGFIAKPKRYKKDKAIQTGIPVPDDSEIVTSESPTLEYWKQLAIERREALEETLKENQKLVQRIQFLESENKTLEEMLSDAKALAEMINIMSDDADESGIGKEEDSTLNTSTSSTSTE